MVPPDRRHHRLAFSWLVDRVYCAQAEREIDRALIFAGAAMLRFLPVFVPVVVLFLSSSANATLFIEFFETGDRLDAQWSSR